MTDKELLEKVSEIIVSKTVITQDDTGGVTVNHKNAIKGVMQLIQQREAQVKRETAREIFTKMDESLLWTTDDGQFVMNEATIGDNEYNELKKAYGIDEEAKAW